MKAGGERFSVDAAVSAAIPKTGLADDRPATTVVDPTKGKRREDFHFPALTDYLTVRREAPILGQLSRNRYRGEPLIFKSKFP